jgi:ankyrin repeat protein
MLDFTNLYKLRKDLCEAILKEDLKRLNAILLENDFINLNYIDSEGQTPLHRSCKIGNIDIVKLLLNNGASLNLTNRHGWYPIHIASYFGYTNLVIYLIQQASSTPDHLSISSTPESTPPSSPQSLLSYDD